MNNASKFIRVLAAGDGFVLPSLLSRAVAAEVSDSIVSEIRFDWPDEPFGPVAEVHEAAGDEQLMIDALQGVDACVTQLGPLTTKIIDACPALRLFAVSRGGPVNANIGAATERGIAVCYAPGRNATAAAEFTIGLVLAALRRIAESHSDLRAGTWSSEHFRYDRCGSELEGSTIGVIGAGAVGARVASVLVAFGARVLVSDPKLASQSMPPGVKIVELAELVNRSQIVSLHARVPNESEVLIGRREIDMMPSGGVIVNTARGGLLDYEALCDSLESGHTAAAALDVFPEEPIPAGSRLLRMPNVVLTPHLGGASRQVAEKAARIVGDEIGRFARGEPLANCLNKEVLSKEGVLFRR